MEIDKPGWSFDKRDTHFIQSMMPLLELLYKYYFRVQTSGWDNIPPGKILLVGSHSGGLGFTDFVLIMYDWLRRFGTERLVYGLMHRMVWKFLEPLASMAEKMGAIVAHPKVAEEAFKRDASILVFPGGGADVFRPFDHWDKINFAGRKGFIKLAIKENVPIVPFISVGAHHTLFVLGDLAPIVKQLHKMGMPLPLSIEPEVIPVYLGLPWGIMVGTVPNIPLPMTIHTKICKPIHFTKLKGKNPSENREYIDNCYKEIVNYMQSELDDLISKSPYKK